ncbi:MAG: hypothetical protein WC860_08040 [Candidatus Margulisiibacteriota bacterium]|jgi:hypothetical protein
MKEKLEIVYLKANDQKSKRTIMPSFVGGMDYNGKPFLGIKAFCLKRQED